MFINKHEDLVKFVESIKDSEAIAVDTEFMREKTYYSKLCLIQIASAKTSAIIDTIALKDLSPLEEVFLNPDIVKVMHASTQDLEIFAKEFSAPVAPIFDTQVAGTLLGYQNQVGYGQLISDLLGVQLGKSDTYSDWSRRPLSPEQIEYARDDVTYLIQAYPIILNRLKENKRLAWLQDEMEKLVNPNRFEIEYDTLYQKLKRINTLRPKALLVAREVAAWREKTAQRRDIPRRWVMGDESIVEIARNAPTNPEKINATRGVRQLNNQDMKSLIEAIERGKAGDVETLPTINRPQKITAEQEVVVDLMNAVVRARALEADISHVQLALRGQLASYLTNPDDSNLNLGWRKELLGEDLDKLISGKICLSIQEGKLLIEELEGE